MSLEWQNMHVDTHFAGRLASMGNATNLPKNRGHKKSMHRAEFCYVLIRIDQKWLYVINLNFFAWRHECHRFLLKFWLELTFSCVIPN